MTVTARERLESEEEVPSFWGRDSRAWESGYAQTFEHEEKHGFMAEERCGLKGDHGKPWTDQDYRDSTPGASASRLADSSNAMMSKPSFWNAEFLIRGSRFVFSQ